MNKIQLPDTSKGQRAMVLVRGIWQALYYKDGKLLRRSLGTTDLDAALKLRNKFHQELRKDFKATVYGGKSVKDKLADKPNLYIYARPPYQFRIGKEVIFESWSEAEVRKVRDKHLAEH